jgi:hypothetical protein
MFLRNITDKLRKLAISHLKRPFFWNLLSLSCAFPTFSEVVITELLRDPAGSESSLCGGLSHEFVEITNFGPETLFILNLFITDGSESDSIIPCNLAISGHERCLYGKKVLLPGQTALILDPDYHTAVDSLNCRMNIKDSTVLWECGDREIGNGLTSTDGIIIYKGAKNEIDTVIAGAFDGEESLSKPNAGKLSCSADGATEGVSIVPQHSLIYPVVYQNNKSLLSPGNVEDLIGGWILDYFFVKRELSRNCVVCSLMIRPVSVPLTESAKWSVISHAGSSRKILVSEEIEPLYITQAFTIELPFDTVQYSIEAGAAARDIDLSSIWTPAGSLRINELFPRSISGIEPEWIELTNISPVTINVANWHFGSMENPVLLASTPFFLKKGAFCIFTSDKALFRSRYPFVPNVIQPDHWYTLNNYRDTLYLFNQADIAADTVYYDSDNFKGWKNQSIERIDASRNGSGYGTWSLSGTSTPGTPNSASSWRNTPSIFIDAGPVPFTPNNDGHDDLYKIICRIPPEQSISISILSFGGKVVKTFNGPSQPEYIWDGKDSHGKLIENGPFFVVVKIDGNKKTSVIRKKGVLWR